MGHDFRDAGVFVFMLLITPVFLVVLVMSILVFGPLFLLHQVVVRVNSWGVTPTT